jgi:hypothetical protein
MADGGRTKIHHIKMPLRLMALPRQSINNTYNNELSLLLPPVLYLSNKKKCPPFKKVGYLHLSDEKSNHVS